VSIKNLRYPRHLRETKPENSKTQKGRTPLMSFVLAIVSFRVSDILAGHDISFVAFADLCKLLFGSPGAVGLLIGDQFDAFDFGVANRAHYFSFAGSVVSQFCGKAFNFSHDDSSYALSM